LYSRLKDRFGRTLLSLDLNVDIAIAEETLLFVYTDGKPRKKAFALLQCISEQRKLAGLGGQITNVLGGALGLGQMDMLGDKIELAKMLSKHNRSYAPWTKHWSTEDADWQDSVRAVLERGALPSATSANEEEDGKQATTASSETKSDSAAAAAAAVTYVICKPSRGQQQRGILITSLEPASFDAIVAHCQSTELEGGPYKTWVLQRYVLYPYCVTGEQIGLLGTPASDANRKKLPSLYQKSKRSTSPVKSLKSRSSSEGNKNPSKRSSSSVKARKTKAAAPIVSTAPTAPVTVENKEEAPLPPPAPPATNALELSDDAAEDVKQADLLSESMLEGLYDNVELHSATAPEPPLGNLTEVANDVLLPELTSATVAPGAAIIPAAKVPEESAKKENALPAISSGKAPRLKKKPPVAEGTYPSDSGIHVYKDEKYKVHFRYYAMVVYDAKQPCLYRVYSCDLFKVYHSKKAYKPYSSEFDESISKYLCMRMGHEVLSESDKAKIIPKIRAIVLDTIELAVGEGGFLPFGFSRTSFQMLGYDFLYDETLDEAVLLEANINPGQGVMKRSVMCPQGMTNVAYERLVRYWTEDYKRAYVDGIMNITVAPGLGRKIPATNVFRHIGSVTLKEPPKTAPQLIVIPPKLMRKLGLDPDHPRAKKSESSVVRLAPKPAVPQQAGAARQQMRIPKKQVSLSSHSFGASTSRTAPKRKITEREVTVERTPVNSRPWRVNMKHEKEQASGGASKQSSGGSRSKKYSDSPYHTQPTKKKKKKKRKTKKTDTKTLPVVAPAAETIVEEPPVTAESSPVLVVIEARPLVETSESSQVVEA
jgi:hypothetical protein